MQINLSVGAPVGIKRAHLDHPCPHWHPLHYCGYISVGLKHWIVVIHIQDLQNEKLSRSKDLKLCYKEKATRS